MEKKITTFKSALNYSFGKNQLPPRELDLYTDGPQLSLFDFDSVEGKILNGIDIDIDDINMESIKTEIFCHIDSTFKFIASCDCGFSIGNAKEGYKCNKCNTVVRSINPDISQFRSMFRLHEQYPKILHPIAYRVFNTWLGKKNNISRLDSILLNPKDFPIELKEAGFEFGLTAFERDFDRIIDFLSTKSRFITNDVLKRGVNIKHFVNSYRDVIFVRNVPILNKSLHIITSRKKQQEGKRKDKKEKIFTDSQVGIIMQMYHILNETRFALISNRRINIDRNIMRFAMTYYSYINEIINKKLSKKKGFIQQNVVAGRFHNTFRGVITPITVPHDADELHIPWTTGVVLLKSEIFNLLRNREKLSFNEALDKLYTAIDEYDPDIHRIINTLIAECPYKGLPTMWDRNPSLNIGSNQLFFITKVKSDVRDKTISIPQATIKSPNADLTEIKCFYFRKVSTNVKKRIFLRILFQSFRSFKR